MLWSILGPLIGPTLDRIIPDLNGRAAAKEALEKALAEGDMEVIRAQLGVQAKEAEHASIFVAGARPFILWVCGLAIAALAVFHIALPWVAAVYGVALPPAVDPQIVDMVLWLTTGLCGIRAFEGWKGVKRDALGTKPKATK